MCSPKKLKELAIGFLRTERLIEDLKDIKTINLDEDLGVVYVETLTKI